jgi:hypothetical protein
MAVTESQFNPGQREPPPLVDVENSPKANSFFYIPPSAATPLLTVPADEEYPGAIAAAAVKDPRQT